MLRSLRIITTSRTEIQLYPLIFVRPLIFVHFCIGPISKIPKVEATFVWGIYGIVVRFSKTYIRFAQKFSAPNLVEPVIFFTCGSSNVKMKPILLNKMTDLFWSYIEVQIYVAYSIVEPVELVGSTLYYTNTLFQISVRKIKLCTVSVVVYNKIVGFTQIHTRNKIC